MSSDDRLGRWWIRLKVATIVAVIVVGSAVVIFLGSLAERWGGDDGA